MRRRHGRVALGIPALPRDPYRRHAAPDRLPVGGDAGEDLPLDEVGDRRRPDEAGREHRCPLVGGPCQQHLADVRVRRPRLVEQVVAVVPPGDQAEVAHGREGGGAGADDDVDMAAQRLEEGGVPGLGALVGGQPRVPARAEHVGERRLHPPDVAVVGHDEDASATRGGRRPRRLGEQRRPVLLRVGGGQGEHGGGG